MALHDNDWEQPLKQFDNALKSANITENTLLFWKQQGRRYEDVVAELEKIGGPYFPIRFREWLVTHYSWAIPNEAAIQLVAQFSPICEIGAGQGYWASRVSEVGGTITAYDTHAWHEGEGFAGVPAPKKAWYPVNRCPDIGFTAPPETTLFLCWPAFDRAWPTDILEAYEGDTFIYVGEEEGGCCGDDAFHTLLHEAWIKGCTVTIPRYRGIRDRCVHYYR